MRYTAAIVLSSYLLFASGWASRYQAFTLVEGAEVGRSSTVTNYSSPDGNRPQREDTHEIDNSQIERRVLVDRRTGTIYYFEGLHGPLSIQTTDK
jgi:hypothetical protein